MEHNAGFNGPTNGGPAPNQMPFANGTPPAGDMSAPPPGGAAPAQEPPKTTLW